MKNVKILLSAALVFVGATALAQDFSAPQYEKWGDTPEQREKNILNSNFLKESCDNRDYNAAAHYLNELINSVPTASVSFYQRGAVIYKNKINRAKSVAEKNTYIDSLMLMYDLRAKYFGDHPKQGTAFILDQKAREYLRYKPSDRKGIREAFRAAIEAGGDNTDPETVVAYFSNLCDDYKNTDEVLPDEIIAEYDRLTPFFEKNPNAGNEYKAQFDAAFGLSGAASLREPRKALPRQARSGSRRRGAAGAGRGADVARQVRRRLLFHARREILCRETLFGDRHVPCAGFPEQGRLRQGDQIPQRGACRRAGSLRSVSCCWCASR